MPDDRQEWIAAADCAARMGLTVRALRLYERFGLICPRRTPSNWRLYGPPDIARLSEIIALKRLGLSLREISKLLTGLPTDVGRLLAMQKSALTEKRHQIDQALRTIDAMHEKIAAGGTLSANELIHIVKDTAMTDESQAAIAWKRYEQMRPRTEIAADPALYSDYEGSYLLAFGDGIVVASRGGRLFMRITGQNDVEVFAEAKDRFFLKAVPAQIVFSRDADGVVNGLELHQNGHELPARRVQQSVIAAKEAYLADRIANKVPLPRSEELLRMTIAQHQRGEVDYATMTEPLAATSREQQDIIRADLLKMGALREVIFKGVSSDGWDVYGVAFENGVLEWSFILTEDGRFSGMWIQPKI